jgi:hypothetical protein
MSVINENRDLEFHRMLKRMIFKQKYTQNWKNEPKIQNLKLII